MTHTERQRQRKKKLRAQKVSSQKSQKRKQKALENSRKLKEQRNSEVGNPFPSSKRKTNTRNKATIENINKLRVHGQKSAKCIKKESFCCATVN